MKNKFQKYFCLHIILETYLENDNLRFTMTSFQIPSLTRMLKSQMKESCLVFLRDSKKALINA
jgi:hypothetical protein